MSGITVRSLLFAGFILAGAIFSSPLSTRADARLVGTWAPSNIPVTVPAGASLTISASARGYSGKATSSFTIPSPVNCTVDTGLELIHFAPLSASRFNLNFTGILPGLCTPVALDSIEAEITFAEDNTSFIACQNSGRCSSWVRIGAAPEPINTKTVPSIPTLIVSKAAVTVSWESLAGAAGYIIKLNGPVTITKTVKRGNSVKFSGLQKGTYKVTLTGTFKDSKGKIRNTRATKAVKASIVGNKSRKSK